MITEQARPFVFRQRRRKTEAYLTIFVSREERRLHVRGKCIDISRRGLLAAVDQLFCEMEEVFLELVFPDTGKIVQILALAHPRTDCRCAFHFLPRSEEEQQSIESALRAY